MYRRWRHNPTYIRIKFSCRQILPPLIIFQFIRTILVPTSFDVIVIGVLAVFHLAIVLDWI